jgi:hypothetical protein
MKKRFALRSCGIATLSLAVCTLMLSAAQAVPIQHNTSFGFPLSPGNQVVSLPQWDPSAYPGFTLVSVGLELTANIVANVTAENDSAIGGNLGVNLTGIAGATAPSLSANAIIMTSAGPVAVTASDGNPGSGTDFVDFGAVGSSDTDSSTIFAGLGSYIGNGTFNATVNGSGGFSVSGVSDSTIQVSDFTSYGSVTVTYEMVPVPEPASMVLGSLGACGLALIAWRRRRSK